MYTECLTADTELTVNEDAMDTTLKADHVTDTSMIEDWFATMPAVPAVSSQQVPDEEELHTSFEHAISDRLITVNRKLSLISGPLTDSARVHLQATRRLNHSYSMPVVEVTARSTPHASMKGSWQRSLLLLSLAMMFLLVGFDIMGLLVLHAH
ncbi:MAG: hypothetical protein E6I91_10050 [Chloroflexi bacterium]|nr:MAG: hypothetical protein E6I91_10050 [Chloroflexota bacterium]